MLSTEAFLRISKEVGAPVSRVETTVSLLEAGATVPFIARYRKEATGNLDEVRIRDIDERRTYYTALDERRETVLSTIEKQGKLTEELKQRILTCFSKNELEDLYLPYKPKRRTKASVALERGLGPLADYIWEQSGPEPVAEFALRFVTAPAVAAAIEDAAQPAEPYASPEPSAEAAALELVPFPSTESAPSSSSEEAAPVAEAGPEPGAEAAEAQHQEAHQEVEAGVHQGVDAGLVAMEASARLPEPASDLPAEPNVESPAERVAEDGAAAPAGSSLDLPAGAEAGAGAQSASEVPAADAAPAASAAVTEPAPAAEKKADPGPKPVSSVEDAIDGALHIVAERVAENSSYRKQLREKLLKEGVVRARVVTGKEAEKTKYEMYYKFEETVPKIPSHRMLAIRRGSRENILTYGIETDGEQFIAALLPQIVKDPGSQFAPLLERAVRDSYERLLGPSLQNEVRSMLRERAETEAIRVFQENLRTLLLSPPAGPIGVIGLDPGIRTGCKLAAVDETGRFLENQTLHITEPHKDVEGAEKALLAMVQKHNVRAITVGNGTASRESEAFVRSVVQKNALNVFVVVVNEAGASVYSASKRAREEFPSLDVTVRGAISIARRLQDPLAELVKIEPRSIGVGQYQHDVDQKKLKHSLEAAVESCVNRVGVDLNSASEDLLKYVSGINDKLASGIIAYRNQSGAFRSRSQLLDIDGFGEKTFEQAAGFLRIREGDNPLDRTAVHPESYPIVEKIAASLGISVGELIENPVQVSAADFKTLEGEAGKFTLADIREELLKPGRDPRDKFVAPKFRDDVKEVVDLKEGMELEGSVTNVTNFGAFVDLGVHQDGLVHISELSHKYVQDAREAVKVGDVVKVKVIAVDPTMKRISLSMKALLPKPPRPPRRKKRPAREPGAEPVAVAAGSPAAGPERPRMQERATRPPMQPMPPKKPRPPQTSQPPRREGPPSQRMSKSPVELAAPAAAQTMEEKIRALQEKFGRVG